MVKAATEARQQQIEKLKHLEIPVLSDTVARLITAASEQEASPRDLSQIIGSDPGLSARILALANSAFFGRREEASTIDLAVVTVGMNVVLGVALGSALVEEVHKLSSDSIDVRRCWQDALLRGCIARAMAQQMTSTQSSGARQVAEAYLVGLLQDIAIPLLAQLNGGFPDTWRKVGGDSHALHELECENKELTHSWVASYLAETWGFAERLCTALANHHRIPAVPESSEDETATLSWIAYTVARIPLRDTHLTAEVGLDLVTQTHEALGISGEQLGIIIDQGEKTFLEQKVMYDHLLPDGCNPGTAIRSVQRLMQQACQANRWVSGLKILLVEPSSVQRRIVASMLDGVGIDCVTSANTGSEAIALFCSMKPDVVLSAMHLPDMTAPELNEELRRILDSDSRAFMVMTSNTEELKSANEQGTLIPALIKPFDSKQLSSGLSKLYFREPVAN